jgi:hypothetical protein
MVRAWRGDRHGPYADLFQPPGSSAPPAGDEHMDVPRARLSRPSLLQGVVRYRDQHPDSRGPCSSGCSKSWHRHHPLREGVDSP